MVFGCMHCWIISFFFNNYSMLPFTFISVTVIVFKLNGATSCRNIEEDDAADGKVSGGDRKLAGENSSVEKQVSVHGKLQGHTLLPFLLVPIILIIETSHRQ